MQVEKNHIEKSVLIFKALSDETRMKILISILNEGKNVSEIMKETDSSQSCISHQLKILKEVNIVKSERKGKCIIYSIDDIHIRELLSQTFIHASEVR